MGHDGVASGYTTPTSFRRLKGCQWDSRIWGVTIYFSSILFFKLYIFFNNIFKIFSPLLNSIIYIYIYYSFFF